MNKNNPIKFLIIFPALITLLSACAFLLGPLTDISLQQRLKSGWTKTDWYTIQPSIMSNMSNFKLKLFENGGKMHSVFGASYNTNAFTGLYINKADESQVITVFSNTAGASGLLDNIFDCTYDATSYGIVFSFNGALSNFNNGTYRNIFLSGSFITAFMFGLDSTMNQVNNPWPTLNYANNFIFNSNLITGSSMDQMRIGKITGKYQDKLIGWYGFHTTNSSTDNITFLDPSTSNFNIIKPLKVSIGEPIYALSLNNSDIYIIKRNFIIKYNSQSETYTEVENYSLPKSLNGLTITSDSFYFYSFNSVDNGVKSISLYHYTPINNKLIQSQVEVSVNTITADLYYDTNTQALFLGLVEFDGQNLHQQVWKNQVN